MKPDRRWPAGTIVRPATTGDVSGAERVRRHPPARIRHRRLGRGRRLADGDPRLRGRLEPEDVEERLATGVGRRAVLAAPGALDVRWARRRERIAGNAVVDRRLRAEEAAEQRDVGGARHARIAVVAEGVVHDLVAGEL